MFKFPKRARSLAALALVAGVAGVSAPLMAEEAGGYGIGREATPTEIAPWDIDVRFDGKGLPPGEGTIEMGEAIYEAQCALCHGDFGQGEGRWPVLAGGFDSLKLQGSEGRPEKTIGSYWPYAPTLFDYIRRAMPYNAPQSLSDEETYALSALILYLNDIVDEDFVANAETLAAVKMPNRDNFFLDPRPDVHNVACMEDCLNADELKLLESITGVTPEQHAMAVEESQPAMAAAANEHGKAVYGRACAVCHETGVAGAPLTSADGKADWEERLGAAGLDGLIQSSLNGKGAMPPQSAAGLNEEDVKAAILHILEQAGVKI